ncbi:MAG: hypothetical protein WA738_20210 [Candidatus Angelobacter sp.]
MPCGTVNGKPTDRENQEHQQRETTPSSQEQAHRGPREPEEHGQEGIRDRAEALALKLARTYEELTRLLERNPGVKRQITEGEAREDKVYQKLKQRLKLADMAPRCRWVRQDGTSCRSPQMKQHIYCFAHMQMAEARTLMLMLPAPEDANAIQVGLMRIQKALIEDTISTKKAGLLLYSMQLALTNVRQTTFGQAKDEEIVRDTVDEEEAFSENRKPFTTKDTEGTKEIGTSAHRDIGSSEHQNLPRMDADERGLQRDEEEAFSEKRKPFTTKDTEDTKEEKGLPRMDVDERGLQREEEYAFSESRKPFTTEGTEDTEKNQGLPLMNTDETDFGEAGGEDGPLNAQNQNLFTTEGTKDTEEEKGLLRMDANERRLQGKESSIESEFVAVPGGYGFERVRLRIEPSGHRDTESSDHREIGTPPRAAAPYEHAEVHNSSLRDECLPEPYAILG